MKTTKKHFEIYKKECQKWIDRFELNNWDVCFGLTSKKGVHGRIGSNLDGYNATLFLCEDWDDRIKPLTKENIKKVAKHEVIHLLLLRLSINAGTRFVTPEQLIEAEEELVRKLENIIK